MTADELLAWLEANHATATEHAVVLHKRSIGVPSIAVAEMVEGSYGSRMNLAPFDELRAEGRVAPAGLAAWEAFPPGARAFWDAQPPGYRKQALHWVVSATRPETRARRLAQLVDDCTNGLRIKPLGRRS